MRGGLSGAPGHSGEILRAAALQSWSRDLLSEAADLFHRAETAFRGAGREAEVLATVRLRVLLHSEMQEGDAALWHYRACDGPGADRLWLKARAALTAAFWFADRGGPGDEAAARQALARGRALARRVADEAERLHLDGLAARATARRLGGLRGNLALASLRHRFLAWLPWIDQLLLGLDIQACRTPAGQTLDLAAVWQDVRRTAGYPPEGHHRVAEAMDLTSRFGPRELPWRTAGFAGLLLRGFFRRDGYEVRPIPFFTPLPGRSEAA